MNKRFLSFLTLLIGATLAASSLAPPASATPPGENGRITFMRQDAQGVFQVWVANADQSNEKQLTFGDRDAGWSTWSPDGTRLAFDSNMADPDLTDAVEINDAFIINADGTGLRNLTGGKYFSGDPSWSPDGTLVTFESDKGSYPAKQGIYVIRPDGSHLRRVTTLPAGASEDHSPRFSPDGKRLVFTRFGPGERNSAIYTIGLNGRGLRQLTPFSIGAGDSDWSPDGKRIVFEAYPQGAATGDIFVVGSNGKKLRNLTHNNVFPNGSADPVWSPDGTQILFIQQILTNGELPVGLATMDADGGHRRYLTETPAGEHQPDWEPVGQQRHH